MNMPLLRFVQDKEGSGQAFVRHVASCLRLYPYFVVIQIDGDPEDPEYVLQLARAICGLRVDGKPGKPPGKVSFTNVENNAEAVTNDGNVTRLSRTHVALPPHTDSSYMENPHEFVAFQMVRNDSEGGESIMVPVDDIVRGLDDETASLLREPIYPFGKELCPILSGNPMDERVRFYEHQLNTSQQAQDSALSDRHLQALDKLEKLLSERGRFHELQLMAGQVMIMNNTKVLHGRTEFSSESDRLLYRVRQHAPCLAPYEPKPAKPQQKPKSGDKPGTIDLDRVKELVRNRETDEALELCAQHLIDHPDDVEVLLLMARALRRGGRHKESVPPLAHAANVAPDDKEVLRAFGDALLREGHDEQALEVFRQFEAIDPLDFDANLSLSALLREKKEVPEARQIIRRVFRREPIDAPRRLDPDKPTILRIRGLQNATFGIVGSGPGSYKVILQGGHFSVNDLIDTRKYNVVVSSIQEDNINQLDGLPEFHAVVNTISCPDMEPESLLSAARFLDKHPDVPVINAPRQVYETARDRNRLRFAGIEGVQFPFTERVRWAGGNPRKMVDLLAGFGFTYPVILRRAGSQTGLSVMKAASSDDVVEYFGKAEPDADYYVIQYCDVRSPSGFFNKSRIFCIDGNYYPVANLFVDDWSVHSGDRYRVMDKHKWMQKEEQRYLGDPVAYLGTRAFESLRKLRDLVKLDFFGIDYTRLPSGDLFIFELNPAMRHNYDHIETFPYTEPYLRRISKAFDYMVARRVEASIAGQKPEIPPWTTVKAS